MLTNLYKVPGCSVRHEADKEEEKRGMSWINL